ncbi:DsbA family protein [Candidatus Woesearchaeota archaeon]|nr:DsbA family protein [Candidatus Woesearchaeota archaeon]
MVLCLVALPVFAILGIFSVRYRRLTKDAVACLFNTVTLRKCKSGLDDRIKAEITGRVISFSPQTARWIYAHYKLLSWLMLTLFVASLAGSIVGIYNYVQYGNCNGPESTGFCVFDPTGSNSKIAEAEIEMPTEIVYPTLEPDDPIIGNPHAELTIIEFGCYACPYTKKAEPIVKEVLEHYDGKVNLQFKTFYIPTHNWSYQSALAANCAQEQGAYEIYHTMLFTYQEWLNTTTLLDIARNVGLNLTQFSDCLASEKYKNEVNADALAGWNAAVPGTPTFFINHEKIVGPKPFKTFTKVIDEELKKKN